MQAVAKLANKTSDYKLDPKLESEVKKDDISVCECGVIGIQEQRTTSGGFNGQSNEDDECLMDIMANYPPRIEEETDDYCIINTKCPPVVIKQRCNYKPKPKKPKKRELFIF